MPLSGKDMRKLFINAGYEIVPGAGKGSHWKLRMKGCPTVTVPNDKELAIGMEHALKKVLKNG